MSGASLPTDQQHPFLPAIPGPAEEVDPDGAQLPDGPEVAANAPLPDLLQAFPGRHDL